MVELAVRIRDEHGTEIAELDLGGGFGIAYTDEDDPPEVKELAQSLRGIVDGQCQAAGLTRPRLTVEPGRGIVGRPPCRCTRWERSRTWTGCGPTSAWTAG